MAGQLLRHDQRRDLVEVDAAIGLGDVGAQQAELAAFPDQLALQLPVFLLEPLVGRHYLAGDELRCRLPNEPMLLGDLLGGHHRRRGGLFDQPRTAPCRRLTRRACHVVSPQ